MKKAKMQNKINNLHNQVHNLEEKINELEQTNDQLKTERNQLQKCVNKLLHKLFVEKIKLDTPARIVEKYEMDYNRYQLEQNEDQEIKEYDWEKDWEAELADFLN
jgi:FtsZ-binding cell division protein ZapB